MSSGRFFSFFKDSLNRTLWLDTAGVNTNSFLDGLDRYSYAISNPTLTPSIYVGACDAITAFSLETLDCIKNVVDRYVKQSEPNNKDSINPLVFLPIGTAVLFSVIFLAGAAVRYRNNQAAQRRNAREPDSNRTDASANDLESGTARMAP